MSEQPTKPEQECPRCGMAHSHGGMCKPAQPLTVEQFEMSEEWAQMTMAGHPTDFYSFAKAFADYKLEALEDLISQFKAKLAQQDEQIEQSRKLLAHHVQANMELQIRLNEALALLERYKKIVLVASRAEKL